MLLAILGGRYVRRRPWIASGCGPTASPSRTTSAQHNPYWARMKISPKSGPRYHYFLAETPPAAPPNRTARPPHRRQTARRTGRPTPEAESSAGTPLGACYGQHRPLGELRRHARSAPLQLRDQVALVGVKADCSYDLAQQLARFAHVLALKDLAHAERLGEFWGNLPVRLREWPFPRRIRLHRVTSCAK